jgi:hypothetical protein
MGLFCLAILLAAGMLLTGCQEEPKGPPPKPPIGYFLSSPAAIESLHRVVFIPLESSDENSDVAAVLTQEVFQAIQARQLFRLEMLDRKDERFETLPHLGRQAASLKDLGTLRNTLKCNAVLFGMLERFQTYPRIQTGLYLQLVDLRHGQLLWGVDNTWDSTEKWTQHRVEEFFKHNLARDYQPANWQLALMSPAAFNKFVADEVAQTLPSHALTEPPKPMAQRAVEKVSEKLANE